MRARRLFTFLWLALMVSPAWAVRIGLFADPQGSSCSLQVPVNTGGTLYILAILDDFPANGITGAEFKITGIPSNWFPSFSASPIVRYQVGGPVAGGCALAFASCQIAPGNRIVPLGTIGFFATTTESNLTVRVQTSFPSNSEYACPLVTLCDTGNDCVPAEPLSRHSKLCVETVDAHVNGSGCTVDASGQVVPLGLALWPNPAPGRATIRFAPSVGEAARIVIYDLAGRRVRQLPDAGVTPGLRSIEWDGRDDAGRAVVSGVYYVQLVTNRSSFRGRLTLLR